MSNSSRKLLWLQNADCSLKIYILYIVSFIIIFGTVLFPVHTTRADARKLFCRVASGGVTGHNTGRQGYKLSAGGQAAEPLSEGNGDSSQARASNDLDVGQGQGRQA